MYVKRPSLRVNTLPAFAVAAPGIAVFVCTSSVAPPIGTPPGPTRRPLIGTRFPNFSFFVDERLFANAVSTTLSATGVPLGVPRLPACGVDAEPEPDLVGSPGRSPGAAVVAVVPPPVVAGECVATTAGVGAEQLVALPPEFVAVTQNCSAWPTSPAVAV